MSAWFCVDCGQPCELNKHGRCEVCGSDAVTFAESLRAWAASSAYAEVVELERLYRMGAI
jgi:hypothetical protein